MIPSSQARVDVLLMRRRAMKRIVVLIDGTWCDEDSQFDTNIAKLDPSNAKIKPPLIKPQAADGTLQKAFYHPGVGAEPDLVRRLLGGAIGLGLKKIVQDAYHTVVDNYESGDELYLVGFSRGAYAARALGGLIGASGIQRQKDDKTFEVAWNNYRVKPAVRQASQPASASDNAAIESFKAKASQNAFHPERSIKGIAVFDTVGSYGVPAGFGLTALARYWALWTLGFHDTTIGQTVAVGLHAVAVDERRRPFVPTFWTCPKDKPPRTHVEQTWFAGVHSNVGGGYADAGLSDVALLWMIARIEALTGLEFDPAAAKAATSAVNLDGEVVDSSQGWIIDQLFPHYRVVLSPDAIEHKAFANTPNPKWENIDERVHWSVVKKRGRPCTYYGKPDAPYEPRNLPAAIPPAKIADITQEESAMWPRGDL
jgi:uncharacterized protein (DUF2235 family)